MNRWLLSLAVLLLLWVQCYEAVPDNKNGIKSTVFLSPKFVLAPGSVADKYYSNIEFPRGHIAIKSFNAEVVDEAGNPIPLHETYLHHWVVVRYYQRKGVEQSDGHWGINDRSDYIVVGNSGICQNNILGQYFGLGSETRRTSTRVPDPYGIEVGNPAEIPDGFEEQWMLNVHAIDTRGAVDRLGCTECKCNLYNVSIDEYGRPLRPDYDGGLLCCYDQMQCRVRDGFQGVRRSLYLKYTVKWVDWDALIVPAKIYIFDVTDTVTISNSSTGLIQKHACRIEYEVESCRSTDTGIADADCVDVKRTGLVMPAGGYVIYGAAHLHSGGISSTLYGQDGRTICSSVAMYGQGKEAGNEEGYIVGMSTCYPKPGSVKIADGETLMVEANYSSSRKHSGVMALFYLLIADEIPESVNALRPPLQIEESTKVTAFGAVAFVAVIVAAVLVSVRRARDDGYQLV